MRPTTLDRLGKIVTGKTPPTSDPNNYGGSVPFVTPTDLDGRRLIKATTRFLSDDGVEYVRSSKIPAGSVLVSCIGSDMGKAAVTAYDAVTNQQINSIVVNAENDALFVYYNLSVRKEEIRAAAGGSAQPILNKTSFGQLPISVPDLPVQKAIGRVLGSLDDKIEFNVGQIDTLETMARLIFKAWFVDFNPVQAKAEGRPPFCLKAETAALFPAEFDDSELGEIPAGWSAVTLADIVTERTGKVGNGNEHVVLSAVASGELKRSDEHFTKQVYSQDTSKYKRVEQWDYAYNPSRINIGSIGMLEEPIVGAVSPVYTVLHPVEGYEWFLRFFLDLPQTKEVINQFCSGSVRQSLSFKDFAAIPVVLPPKEIAEAFTRRWQELNTLRQKLAMQSSKLAEARDTLLPKLMSGELRVPDELMA